MSYLEHNICYILLNYYENIMDEEELDEFIYEFHERVLGLTPERDEPHEWSERPEWDWIRRK